MARNRLQKDRKVCATCEYWLGERCPAGQAKNWVEFEFNQTAGCMQIIGRKSNPVAPACHKYDKIGWLS